MSYLAEFKFSLQYCVCMQPLLNAVGTDPQTLSRHGKNAALEKSMFRRINKSLSLLICRSRDKGKLLS